MRIVAIESDFGTTFALLLLIQHIDSFFLKHDDEKKSTRFCHCCFNDIISF